MRGPSSWISRVGPFHQPRRQLSLTLHSINIIMLHTRWGSAIARFNGQNARLTSWTRTGTSTYRAYSKPHAPIAVGRAHYAKSRVASLTCTHARAGVSRQVGSSSRWQCPVERVSSVPVRGPILHSAFPTKTVIFFVVVIAATYYFVEIKEEDWADFVLASFAGDPGATPLHFYKDREEVDHWTQYHIPDPSAPLKDPEVLRQISEQFPKIAFGWEIQPEESVEFEIPVTHGIRFKSNEPCVSYPISQITLLHGM